MQFYTSSFKTWFFFSLIMGILMVLSSSSWFMIWMGLEMNLLSFIPLLSSKFNIYSSEAALKYFLVQAFGSVILFLSASLFFMSKLLAITLMAMSLFLKMGASPMHFWLPMIMQGISWPLCLLLTTVQKVAPMTLIFQMNLAYPSIQVLTFLSSILSALTGAFLGLNQTFLRKLMAFSSISHMSWLLASIYLNLNLWCHYFAIYCVISLVIFYFFNKFQIFHINQLHRTPMTPQVKMTMYFSLLSLGGLPPFLGFIPKLMVIQALANNFLFFWLLILLSCALISLFFYIRIIMLSGSFFLHNSNTNSIYKMKNNPTFINVFFLLLNLFPLIIPTLLFTPFL
uniref:NADH dehydrogenase subunit 2 n=1 Tax=Latreutes anoplonyx TaxID=3061097 RepID=UPI00286C7D58|nr:NADH dehydrogenase subunit 2 [Latreutes anoplonyx]WKF54300.1 NADH dehydrogenase subunit 2 [Latreutes anoplonyx]